MKGAELTLMAQLSAMLAAVCFIKQLNLTVAVGAASTVYVIVLLIDYAKLRERP